jgi:hypothetical protein
VKFIAVCTRVGSLRDNEGEEYVVESEREERATEGKEGSRAGNRAGRAI